MRAVVLATGLSVALCASAAAQRPAGTVEITPSHASTAAGRNVRFTAVVRDSTGAVVPNAAVMWFATPFDIAFAEADGEVRPLRQGTASVLAMAGGAFAQATLVIGPKPPASLRLELPPELVVGGTAVATAVAYTEDGESLRDAAATFRSSEPRIAAVAPNGLVTALAPGEAVVQAAAGDARGEMRIRVIANPVSRLELEAPAAARTGDVVRFTLRALDARGRPVASPQATWSVGGAGAEVYPDGALVAERAGTYVVTAAVGGVTASAAVRITRRVHDRRLVPVATRVLTGLQAAEHWAIGDVLYVSTAADRVYAYDIRDPANPTLVDSVVVDARHINDVSTTADGRIGVITREGASSRRNGLVFLDLADPLRPKVLSEYTATLSGGVHSAYVDGRYVYATDDATGSLRVIDFQDPSQPREVGRWEIEGVGGVPPAEDPALGVPVGASVGRYLHDVQVKDGLAYLAYWRHGLVILDVGAGLKGGSPERPEPVGRFTYNVLDYYPADRIAGTHAVFRYGRYVFVGDEVFPGMFNIGSPARIEALGIVHVVDVSDIERPRKVAEYRMPGGSHNMWVDDDVLYIGAYEGGLRALDVSGELRGDLAAQGREIGAVWTGSPEGFRPNLPFAWGAQPHRGFVFATDMNSGVWVARLERMVLP